MTQSAKTSNSGRFQLRSALLATAALAAVGLIAGAQNRMPPDAVSLQPAVDRAMAGLSGTVAILDVKSGRLLAHHRIEVAARRLAPPGSTLKPVTLHALLEAQAVQPDTRFVCPIKLQLAGHRMDCSHPRIPAPMNPVSALAHSCNGYFAHFASRLDDSVLNRAMAQAGLTSATGLAPDEAVGVVQPSETSEGRRLKALGVENIRVTPLGLLSAYRRLALARRQAPRDSGLNPIFDGLEASVAMGMAHAARVEGMSVAGKTGTAGAAEGNWTHAWFAGYAPAEKPEIAVVVFLERGTGAHAAAPVAQKILVAFRDSRRQP